MTKKARATKGSLGVIEPGEQGKGNMSEDCSPRKTTTNREREKKGMKGARETCSHVVEGEDDKKSTRPRSLATILCLHL